MSIVKRATYYDRYILQRDAVRRCNRQGITLKLDPRAATAYSTIDPDTVVIPDFIGHCTTDEMDLLRNYVVHECGHLNRREAFKVLLDAKIRQGDVLGYIFNVCEDEQMERVTQRRWPGDRLALERGRQLHIAKMNREAKEGTFDPDAEHVIKSMAVYGLGLQARSDWDRNAKASLTEFLRTCVPKGKALCDQLIREGWADRLAQYMTPLATMDFAEALKERLYPPQPEQEKQESGEGKGEPQPAQGDSEPGEGEGTEGDDKGDEGKGSQDEGKPDTGEGKGADDVKVWDNVVVSAPTDDGPPSGATEEFDTSGIVGVQGAPYPEKYIETYDWRTYDKTVEKGMDMLENKCRRAGERYTYPHWTDDTKGHRALANQIRQYIQAKRRTKWQKERKTGRQLNKRCLSRLATGTGEYNKRVFQQRIDHKDLNTAIMVLVDWSGSMGGTKAFYANLSAQRMSAVFSDALGIPLKIMTHTSAGTSMHDGNPRLIFGTVKDWDDKRPAPKAIADRFIRAAHCRMGANADADALMMARHELMKRPEARKILIILSDGLPSLSYVNSDSRAASNSYAISGAAAKVMLKDCVKELAADGNIDFYAIGLQTRGLDQYYGDGNVQTVMEDTDLSAVLLKTMRDCVIKPEKL